MSSSDVHSSEGRRGISPLLSVIIPVYNVADYLADCLNSITQQDFKDIEIIAVDGASCDESKKILYTLRKNEPRLTVVPMDKPGPGQARNAGVERASGEYIWFVDGDDLISANCLALIANRIEATRPDVLFIDYEAFYPDGRSELGHGHDLMGRETPDSFTLAEQPWVIDFSMASWKKIIRREFYRSTSVAFWLDSPHEDIEVSCRLLMDASRLSLLNQVCYRYQKDRPGSAMGDGDRRRHFRIFHAYESVLDQVKERANNEGRSITEEVWHKFFERAIWHYATIFDTPNYIVRKDRREFFKKMRHDYRQYLPRDYHRPRGFRGLKFLLIERDDYVIYNIMAPVNKLRLRMAARSSTVRRQLTAARR